MRHPALAFLAAGALLFAATHWWAPPPALLPAEALGDGALGDESLLLREAFALGLDDSPPVRDRLRQLGAALELAGAGDGLVREARAVGLQRSDPIVRRHLVELLRLAAATPRTPPDEAALQAYYAIHAARFAVPERVRLTQIYLSPARRGGAAAADADALLRRLRQAELDEDAAIALGDGLGRAGARLGPLSRDALGRTLGAAFATAAFALPDGDWHGPLPSAYGWHVVRVDERLPAAVPELARVHGRVVHAQMRQRGEAQLGEALAALRAGAAAARDTGAAGVLAEPLEGTP